MDHYNFTEADKLLIAEDDGKCTLFFCPDHHIYIKYKGINSTTCPWCNKSNDPIQNVRELKKKFKHELNLV